MNNNIIALSVIIAMAGFGIEIENAEETENNNIMYISVPERSQLKDINGEEMSGKNLAVRVKEKLNDSNTKKLIVKFKVRKGEFWTKEHEQRAIETYKKMLLNL